MKALLISSLLILPLIAREPLAQRIVTYREQQGRFTSVEQLDDVPGIGPSIYDQLKTLVTV